MSTRLWFNKIKEEWINALPLGNGRIAAMFYGNPYTERIEINEESLWSGAPLEEKYSNNPSALKELRALLFEEKYEQAADLARKNYLSNPKCVRPYQTFGEIFIDFEDKTEVKDYYKYLELSDAIAGADYKKADTEYKTECFVSEKYDTFVYRAQSCNNEAFGCNIRIKRERNAKTFAQNNNTLLMTGKIIFEANEEFFGEGGEGLNFISVIKIKTDGKTVKKEDSIDVCDATFAEVYAAFETNYDVNTFSIDNKKDIKSIALKKCEEVYAEDYNKVKKENIKNHAELFNRVCLELGKDEEKVKLPTDERVISAQNGEEDLDLVSLYYNFGRYLLIESSAKKATLPANLQGKWCTGFNPPWGSDYHTNINIQMNYWPCETANLSESFEPYNHFVTQLSLFGKDTAKRLYNTRGWTVHHTTNIFGRCGVHDSVDCGFFPMAGPWLCLNLWEHFEFTDDLEYLKKIYPVLKGSCEFLLDFLVESLDGFLVTNPSNSPENKFYYYNENGEKKESMFTYGATMDFEIIHCIFTRVMSACKLLGIDADFSADLERTLKRLPPIEISERYGTIREWIKDYEEVEPSHRHISHLFALFPSDQINEDTPELFQAAKRTIQRRLSHGGGATGWSRAWIINFYARLKDGENAWESIKLLLKNSTALNLLDMHPPFQIDGNFGAVAGITEMLIQSHLGNVGERIVQILPALPKAWQNGSVKGIKARGNFEFDIVWKNSKPKKITVKSLCNNTLRLKLSNSMKNFSLLKEYSIEDSVLKLDLIKNESVEINF